MAGVEDDDNVTFTVLLYAYIIAREEEDEQQPDQPQPQKQRARRAAVRQFWVRPWLTETTAWPVLQPPRHPIEAGGSSSVPKLHKVNTAALR